jgi:hypothetical protein
MRRSKLLFILPLLFLSAAANVEKVIFAAPPAESLPDDASIHNLLLPSLSEARSSIRTHVNASFPTTDAPRGDTTWLLLQELRPGRRYEVRVCWLATVSFMYGSTSMRRLIETATNGLLAIYPYHQIGLRQPGTDYFFVLLRF